MLFSSFARNRKPKQFHLHTRFYDERKEELQNRYAEIEANITGKKKNQNNHFSPNFKKHWESNRKTSTYQRKSNLRIVFISIILFFLFYWIVYV